MHGQGLNISSFSGLPQAQIQKALQQLTEDECDSLLHDWRFFAREAQIAPDAEWLNWLVLAGRGFGKTRTGAEWVREQIQAGKGRVALIAPTASDARDVMVEGESGILSVCWSGDRDHKGETIGRPSYEPSKRRLTWANGAQATTFSAEEPERLRGPQHDAGWCDEMASWKYMRDTWDMYQFGLRLGDDPRTVITTTPKPLKLIREILKDPLTIPTRGSTYDNADNLAKTFLKAVKDKYEGTRLGRQELHAEIMEEAEGALWTRQMLDTANYKGALPDFARIVVAVDPAITAKAESDETGVITCGVTGDGMGYVLDDVSGRYSPGDWAKKAVGQFDKYNADRIVAEGNQGGEMVRHTIHTERKGLPVSIVHASRGKYARAEPVAALYEQSRVRHVAGLDELEDQLVNWEPLSGMESPDRLDAMVWGLTDLMVTGSTYTLSNL